MASSSGNVPSSSQGVASSSGNVPGSSQGVTGSFSAKTHYLFIISLLLINHLVQFCV